MLGAAVAISTYARIVDKRVVLGGVVSSITYTARGRHALHVRFPGAPGLLDLVSYTWNICLAAAAWRIAVVGNTCVGTTGEYQVIRQAWMVGCEVAARYSVLCSESVQVRRGFVPNDLVVPMILFHNEYDVIQADCF